MTLEEKEAARREWLRTLKPRMIDILPAPQSPDQMVSQEQLDADIAAGLKECRAKNRRRWRD